MKKIVNKIFELARGETGFKVLSDILKHVFVYKYLFDNKNEVEKIVFSDSSSWKKVTDNLSNSKSNIPDWNAEILLGDNLRQLTNSFIKENKDFENFLNFSNTPFEKIDEFGSELKEAFLELINLLNDTKFTKTKFKESLEVLKIDDSIWRADYLLSPESVHLANLGKLVSELFEFNQNDLIYDPCVGAGTFLAEISKSNPNLDLKFIGSDINVNVLEEAFINSLVNVPNLKLMLGDSTKQKPLSAKPSHVVSELPLGMRMPFQRLKNDETPKNFSHRDGSVRIIENSIESISDNGKGFFITTPSTLVNNTKEITIFRKLLVEKDYIRSIINLPPGALGPLTRIPAIVMILDKNKKPQYKDKFQVISISEKNQFKKTEDFLNDETIELIVKEFNNYTFSLNSEIITKDEVVDNNFVIDLFDYSDSLLNDFVNNEKSGFATRPRGVESISESGKEFNISKNLILYLTICLETKEQN